MIVLLDNRDSFVYTLARYVGLLGYERTVLRSDRNTLDDIKALNPASLIISPGPCTPHEAGISKDAIRAFGPDIPVLGVCLGHQCIAEVYGGRCFKSGRPIHGKPSTIFHTGSHIFDGLPVPLSAGRYHSLIVDIDMAGELEPLAWTQDGTNMALKHRFHPVYGVQFHPESVLTSDTGLTMLRQFFNVTNITNTHDHADLAKRPIHTG